MEDTSPQLRYELAHDSIAKQVAEKASVEAKNRRKVKALIERGVERFNERQILLTADDLDIIKPFESNLYLSDAEQNLLKISRHKLHEEEIRKRNIRWAITSVLTIFLAFALLQWYRASEQRKEARFQAKIAQASLMASEAEKELNKARRQEALIHAAEGYKILGEEAPAVVIQQLSDVFHAVFDEEAPLLAHTYTGHSDGVFWSDITERDGKLYMLSGSQDSTAHLWDREGNLLQEFRHKGTVSFVKFGKDEIWTASADSISQTTAARWSWEGEKLASFHHPPQVIWMDISYKNDLVVTGSRDGSVKIWKHDGTLVKEISAHDKSVRVVRFSPDESQFATIGDDGRSFLWELDGEQAVEYEGHRLGIEMFDVHFSPDGKKLLTASADNTAKLWTLGGELIATLDKHTEDVRRVDFTSSGGGILTVGREGTAMLWDSTGNYIRDLDHHKKQIIYAAFSPDDERIITTCMDGSIHIVSIAGRLLADLSPHEEAVFYANFSASGKQIITASLDGTSMLWDFQLGHSLMKNYDQHSKSVLWVNSFAPNGKVVTTSKDETALIWQEKVKAPFVLNHKKWVTKARFSPDGSQLLTASRDKTAKLWQLEGDTASLVATLPHKGYVEDINFSPDSKLIITASRKNATKLWDNQGNILDTLQHKSRVISATFSPDGQAILTGSWDKQAHIWDLQGNKSDTLVGHSDKLISAQYSPDGRMILTVSQDDTMRLWKADCTPLAIMTGPRDDITEAHFSPDGQWIVSASEDSTARLYNIKGKLVRELPHHARVKTITFSPDGHHILSASNDNLIILWNLKGEKLITYNKHKDWIRKVHFSADGRYFYSASEDGTSKRWAMPKAIYEWVESKGWLDNPIY